MANAEIKAEVVVRITCVKCNEDCVYDSLVESFGDFTFIQRDAVNYFTTYKNWINRSGNWHCPNCAE